MNQRQLNKLVATQMLRTQRTSAERSAEVRSVARQNFNAGYADGVRQGSRLRVALSEDDRKYLTERLISEIARGLADSDQFPVPVIVDICRHALEILSRLAGADRMAVFNQWTQQGAVNYAVELLNYRTDQSRAIDHRQSNVDQTYVMARLTFPELSTTVVANMQYDKSDKQWVLT